VERQTYGYLPGQGHHCRVTGTKLYCLMIEVHVCEQLPQGYYMAAEQPAVCLSVCMYVTIFWKPRVQTLPKFLWMLPVAVAVYTHLPALLPASSITWYRHMAAMSSCCGIVVGYVFPVLLMTSCFTVVDMVATAAFTFQYWWANNVNASLFIYINDVCVCSLQRKYNISINTGKMNSWFIILKQWW